MVGLGVQCLRKQTHQTPINGIQTERQKLLTPNRPKHSALAALRDILCLSSGNFGKATSDFFGAPKVREQRREWLLEVTRLLDSRRANSTKTHALPPGLGLPRAAQPLETPDSPLRFGLSSRLPALSGPAAASQSGSRPLQGRRVRLGPRGRAAGAALARSRAPLCKGLCCALP